MGVGSRQVQPVVAAIRALTLCSCYAAHPTNAETSGQSYPRNSEENNHRQDVLYSTTEPGRAVLYGEPYGGEHSSKTRKNTRVSSAFLSGDGALSRFAQSPTFPSTEWKPGQRYDTVTVFKFGARPK